MSESDQQSQPAVAAERDGASSNGGREPGWYSRGRNPNEQSYWDGEGYTETRHWVGGHGWAEGAAAGCGKPGKLRARPRCRAGPPERARHKGRGQRPPASALGDSA